MASIPFKEEETEVQRGLKTRPRPHGMSVAEWRLAQVSVPLCHASLEKPLS